MSLNFELVGDEKERYLELASKNVPRHTSYPGSPYWSKIPNREGAEMLYRSAVEKNRFSLYIHIPFCQSLCFYCGCTRDIVPDPKEAASKSLKWLSGLESEICSKAKIWGKPNVCQVHLGGGTPTYLPLPYLEKLLLLIETHFNLSSRAEKSVELDPRVTTREQIELLAKFGFNRISMGIQDFDLKVQKTVNRVQSIEMIKDLSEFCKKLDFKINYDLICGLPFQTLESIEETIDKVISLNPDRIAWYRFAMIPDLFKWQRGLKNSDLPNHEQLLEMNLLAINKFSEAKYFFIGLDHFSKKEDSLTKSLLNGSIVRNFQGMSVGPDFDIIGLGPSAISQFGEGYIQNPKSLNEWIENVDPYMQAPICKLSFDDQVRGYIIRQFYCYGYLDIKRVEKNYNVNFESYFKYEMNLMKNFENDGIVEIDDQTISLSRVSGRLLVRAVASCFDKYFNQARCGKENPKFSRLG